MLYSPYIAAQRFGLGAGETEIAKIAQDPKQWLHNQTKARHAAVIKGRFESTGALCKFIAKARDASAKERKGIIKQGRNIFQNEMQARFTQAVTSNAPLQERMVQFWSNHFTVSLKGKAILAPLMGAFEREAIRPHIFGQFSDMLKAVVQHPAMLIYLDNVQSIGPNSKVGKKRNKGLNENLAREILELHTLGVNGGYTQDDVIGLAKIITGWMIVPPKLGGGGFRYIHQAHEPGAHLLLGKLYKENQQQQGLDALDDLARHPSTAKFIATKLARHFIADSPPEGAVNDLVKIYLKTDGNLQSLMQNIINMDEVWAHKTPKVKTPYEMIIANFRLTGAAPDKVPFKHVLNSLTLFEHAPFQAPSPAGWSDKGEDWLSPNAMMNRVEWCHAFAQAIRPQNNPYKLAQIALGSAAHQQTLFWIERAPTPEIGLALLLASPEWQRR